ncbi:beta-ketoacyl synthase chain length factor [Pseudoroseomonas globiformis]|uniref:Beta-ketoacyl synthase chain length factor n=1 Tax=Teichococcus globiformis TaxID=2307229 RepID=A0ABV7G489_9PROT
MNSSMVCRIGGVGLLGAGLPGWTASRTVLAGERAWHPEPPAIPAPAMLPATERRRASLVVRLALAAAAEAVAGQAGTADDEADDASQLDTVFASGNGDGATVGAILEALTQPGGDVSPTQFHNSVHNAAAGYWGIGARSMRPSTSLGGHDDTFPLGLLQAAAQVAWTGRPVLFCACDAPMPPPLDSVRPCGPPFAVALLLRPDNRRGASLVLRYSGDTLPGSTASASPLRLALEDGNPAARALPLLEALAGNRTLRHGWALRDGGMVLAEFAP